MSHSTSQHDKEELSQAKARLGVSIVALLYLSGWTLLSGPVPRLIFAAVALYALFSIVWIRLVRARPGDFAWRKVLVIFTDLGINTLFMHILQDKGTIYYPIYLWIIVGNGVRFGTRYLLLAMAAGVGFFAPMLRLSSYWQDNLIAGIGLLGGLIVLPLFYLSLIKKLHASNAQLAEEAARAQAAARAKADFLANMNHELRTPMCGILGVTELLQDTELAPVQRQHLDLIHRSASSLLHIINDVLDFSALEERKISLESQPLDIKEIVDDVYHLLRSVADEKNLAIQLEFPEQRPRMFIGDSTRIRQILFNLIGNAVKFTESGEIVIAYECEESTQGRSRVHFHIHDTGIGIPVEKLEHIFEKFEQVDTRPDRRFGGSGLGLAISRQLARMMGGDIAVSSQIGKGTTFTVSLVLERSHETPLSTPSSVHEEPFSATGLTALVVEDHPVNLLIIRGLLTKLGVTVAAAEDGESALARFRQGVFDLIFMDVQLPVMDGLEATRRIRAEEQESHIPIVALTANSSKQAREACHEAGMDIHLSKPFQMADLVSALRTLKERGLIARFASERQRHIS